MSTIRELLEEDLSGDIIEILDDEFAIGNYAIEGHPKKRSNTFVFAKVNNELNQFCIVSPNWHQYITWFEFTGIENLPNIDIYKNNIAPWRDRNIRFRNLIKRKYGT